MSYKTDLHIHSSYSDGTMRPVDLVRKYKDAEYDMISITDHDGIDGLAEAMIAGEALKIAIVPGIELSTDFNGLELHILGYYFDKDNITLNNKLALLKKFREERNEKMLSALRKMGIQLTEDDLKQRPGQTYIGKPNFARALVSKGYINTPKEAFLPGQFLESPEIKAVKREKLSAKEAIDLITEAGGICVLAHPGKIKNIGIRGSSEFFQKFEELLHELKKEGLKGLECYYPEHTEEEIFAFVELAGKYHLHITEGSDYHGDDMQ